MSKFMECEACHNVLSDQAAFCPKCGHPVQKKPVPANPKTPSGWSPAFKVIISSLAGAVLVIVATSWMFASPDDQARQTPAAQTAASSGRPASAASSSDLAAAAPAASVTQASAPPKPKGWIKLSAGVYTLVSSGGPSPLTLLATLNGNTGQVSINFANPYTKLCAGDDTGNRGEIGFFKINGTKVPFRAICLGGAEIDQLAVESDRELLNNIVANEQPLMIETPIGIDAVYDPTGFSKVRKAFLASTNADPANASTSETASGSTAQGSPDEKANMDIKVTSYTPSKNTEQLYTSNDSYSFACSDKTFVPEVYNLINHNSNSQQLNVIYKEGGCFTLLLNFKVLAHETLQVPAGPQKMVKIEIDNDPYPQAPPKIAYAMEYDVRPLNPPTPGN